MQAARPPDATLPCARTAQRPAPAHHHPDQAGTNHRGAQAQSQGRSPPPLPLRGLVPRVWSGRTPQHRPHCRRPCAHRRRWQSSAGARRAVPIMQRPQSSKHDRQDLNDFVITCGRARALGGCPSPSLYRRRPGQGRRTQSGNPAPVISELCVERCGWHRTSLLFMQRIRPRCPRWYVAYGNFSCHQRHREIDFVDLLPSVRARDSDRQRLALRVRSSAGPQPEQLVDGVTAQIAMRISRVDSTAVETLDVDPRPTFVVAGHDLPSAIEGITRHLPLRCVLTMLSDLCGMGSTFASASRSIGGRGGLLSR